NPAKPDGATLPLRSRARDPSNANRPRSPALEVLSDLNADGAFSLGRRDLLEQPLLEHLDLFEGLRARRIHDEVRVPRGHTPGKEPNEPAGCQVRFDERCARQGDTEAGDGRR